MPRPKHAEIWLLSGLVALIVAALVLQLLVVGWVSDPTEIHPTELDQPRSGQSPNLPGSVAKSGDAADGYDQHGQILRRRPVQTLVNRLSLRLSYVFRSTIRETAQAAGPWIVLAVLILTILRQIHASRPKR